MKIILSANEDPTYLEFWEPVSWAYKKIFPDWSVHLAFLTNRTEDDELVTHLRKFGEVTLFPMVDDVPEFGQAKMIRFLLASQQEDVCYIDDIDLLPLSKSFITDKVNKRPANHLLCVGGEVYHNNGCYPVSQMTAEGALWKALINPQGKSYRELMDEWSSPVKFDRRENIKITTNFAVDDYFSDERLIRRLRLARNIKIFEMGRGYKDFMVDTVDRYDWKINPQKLKNHGYLNAHCARPYGKNKEIIQPLLDYISENY